MFGRRKSEAVLIEVPSPWGLGSMTVDEAGNPVGPLTLGSMCLDDDADADVVGEAKHREYLCEQLDYADDEEVAEGRVMLPDFTLVPAEHGRVAVLLTGEPVGFLADEAALMWGPLVREWLGGAVTEVRCSGFILWDAGQGDPRDDDAVALGVRLDLRDQR